MSEQPKTMHIETEGMLSLQATDFIGQSVAVLGIKGSGKSNTAAVLMEELLASKVPVAIVDIAGEYHTLKTLYPDITTVGRAHGYGVDIPVNTSNARQVAETAYSNGRSVVLDVSGMSEEREEILRLYFSRIWEVSATKRVPLVIFLEEAHNWIPQKKSDVKKVFIDIASEGRKRGLSLVVIGQRSARIDKDVLTQADIAFLHRVRHPIDLKVYIDMIPRDAKWVRDKVNTLGVGESLTLLGERVLRCKIRSRTTVHVGATPSLADVPTMSQMSLFDLLKAAAPNGR